MFMASPEKYYIILINNTVWKSNNKQYDLQSKLQWYCRNAYIGCQYHNDITDKIVLIIYKNDHNMAISLLVISHQTISASASTRWPSPHRLMQNILFKVISRRTHGSRGRTVVVGRECQRDPQIFRRQGSRRSCIDCWRPAADVFDPATQLSMAQLPATDRRWRHRCRPSASRQAVCVRSAEGQHRPTRTVLPLTIQLFVTASFWLRSKQLLKKHDLDLIEVRSYLSI